MLRTFLRTDGLPAVEAEIIECLSDEEVREIRHFVLGPGLISNIPQACQRFVRRTGLEDKSTIVPGKNPDVYLEDALAVNEPGVVPIFWTCAVYGREKDLFFGRATSTSMFFLTEVMPLDRMQLVVRPGDYSTVLTDSLRLCGTVPGEMTRVASHKSPQPLLGELLENNRHLTWVEADSNGAAAVMCKNREVDLAIATETARVGCGLAMLHDFGSPPMVFFGGLTEHGATIIRRIYRKINEVVLNPA